jgi:hypothetical protein
MGNINSTQQPNPLGSSFSLRGSTTNNVSTGNIGSLYRKYNYCKNSGVSDVTECVLNPNCCPKNKTGQDNQ